MHAVLQRPIGVRPDGNETIRGVRPWAHAHKDGPFRLREPLADFCTEALDRLGRGLFIVTKSGILLLCNRTAENLLSDSLHLHRSRLYARDRAQTESLHQLIVKAATHNTTGSMIITGTDGPGILLSVLPICATPWRSRHGQHGAMLISKQFKSATPRRLDAISRHYGLTPAETRVAGELILGDGIAGVALRLNISEATARTHVIRLFQKTGTGRQAQLIGLLLEESEGLMNDAGVPDAVQDRRAQPRLGPESAVSN